MAERPILFSDEMVRAILKGQKTQTRRVVKQGSQWVNVKPGDTLWVREAWAADLANEDVKPRDMRQGFLWFRATAKSGHKTTRRRGRWRPSIFMPRWASRLTLGVTAVRAEPLWQITAGDAYREGVGDKPGKLALEAFEALWDSINAERGYPWADNPDVYVIEFEVLDD